MSTLTHTVGYVMYDDSEVSNNPSSQFGNWKKNTYNVTISKPSGPTKLTLTPAATSTIFSGTRSLTYDGTTQFALTLNPFKASTYRLTATSGTVAGFRTKRAADLNGQTVTITVNNNAVANFTQAAALTGVQVGDQFFIPGTITGDSASPFSETNVGYWVVLSVSGTNFTATRLAGESFSAVAQVVSVTNSSQIVFFTSSGVQVGDTLDIDSGFSSVTRKNFTVSNVSWNWIEFVSSEPLPLESGITITPPGLTIYSSAKRWVRIECDQPIVLRFNGETSDRLEIVPRANGIQGSVAWFDSWGLFYSLDIVNKSVTSSVTIVISTGE